MKKPGYLYIAFNNGLLPGLLKIGISADDPETGERLNQLSQPTGVPGRFKLAYKLWVLDMLSAESRVHLLLREYRFDAQKEFFKVNKNQAIATIKRVARLLNNSPSPELELRNDFIIYHRFSKKLRGHFYRLFHMTLAFSHTNSFFDKLQGFPLDIADGFLCVENVQRYHLVQAQQVRHQLKNFAMFAQDLTVCINNSEPFKIYEDIRYGRGQLIWSFNPALKEQFISG